MECEWDEGKDAANRAKHGVSLAEAVSLDWAWAQERPDLRTPYGELRVEAIAPLHGRLHVCIYTMREAAFRVISLRKANAREEKRYGKTDPK